MDSAVSFVQLQRHSLPFAYLTGLDFHLFHIHICYLKAELTKSIKLRREIM